MLFLIAVLQTTIRVGERERDDTRKLPFPGATMLSLIGFFSVGRRRDPHAWKETSIDSDGDGDGGDDDARQAPLAGNDRRETRDARREMRDGRREKAENQKKTLIICHRVQSMKELLETQFDCYGKR